MFRSWIENEHECIITREIARKWLHILGFKLVNHQKGVYFDGHKRDDVVAYRKVFLDKLTELDRRCVYGDHSQILFPGELPLVPIHHDKCTFFC